MLRRPFGFETRLPMHEMERLRREMNRLFAGPATAPRMSVYPAINVWTNEDGALVTAELPGIDADDLDISVRGATLTLSGGREPSEEACECERYHRQERGFGKFSRTFELPFQVEADQVEAAYEKGVLSITLPRAEADKPRKITVKVGSTEGTKKRMSK